MNIATDTMVMLILDACFVGDMRYSVEVGEQSDDDAGRAGYQSGTDDERSNDAFANLRARSRSPVHTTAPLNDMEHSAHAEQKRARTAMSDTDTSGDEDLPIEDQVREVTTTLVDQTSIDASIAALDSSSYSFKHSIRNQS